MNLFFFEDLKIKINNVTSVSNLLSGIKMAIDGVRCIITTKSFVDRYELNSKKIKLIKIPSDLLLLTSGISYLKTNSVQFQKIISLCVQELIFI